MIPSYPPQQYPPDPQISHGPPQLAYPPQHYPPDLQPSCPPQQVAYPQQTHPSCPQQPPQPPQLQRIQSYPHDQYTQPQAYPPQPYPAQPPQFQPAFPPQPPQPCPQPPQPQFRKQQPKSLAVSSAPRAMQAKTRHTHQVTRQKVATTKPRNYLWLSVFALICCCSGPCGLIALVSSLQVDSAWKRGDLDRAQSKSKAAIVWNIIGIVGGILSLAAVIAVVVYYRFS